MPIPDVELIITRNPGGLSTASLRMELPNRRADLAEDVPIALNDEALRSLLIIPDAYAGALTGMVFVPPLREAWQRALGYAEGAGEQLRVRLHLRGETALHTLRWELLRDPVTQTPLAYGERVALSRFLSSDHLGDVQARTKPRLSAIVAVSGAAGPGMAAVDVAEEVERAVSALGDVPAIVLDGRDGHAAATLPALADALRDGPQLLYLVCHGALSDNRPYLYLEHLAGEPSLPIPGADFVRQIVDLARRPLLVILASCRGAGDDYETLAAVGPQLARAGVGAVIAMQGDVPMEVIAQLIPRLLTELGRDGQIDRALAAARAALPADQPWWMPVLWMAVKDGRLWEITAALLEGRGTQHEAPPPLPTPPASMPGRVAAITEIAEALRVAQPRGATGQIRGMAGVGKTTVAYAIAAALADYAPWQIVVSLRGASATPASTEEVLRSAIRRLGYQGDLPAAADVLRETYRKLAAQRKALILADDAGSVAQLRELRPPQGAILLVTSRLRLALRDSVDKDLETLDPQFGAELVRLLHPPVGEHAEELARQCGGLPLAIEIATGYLKTNDTRPVADYLEQLRARRLALLRDPEAPDDPETSVAASLELSVRALTSGTRHGFGALSLFPDSFDYQAALAVIGGPEAADVVDELRRHNLIRYDERNGRLWFHMLVREFAAGGLAAAERGGAEKRFVSHMSARIEAPAREPSGALRELWRLEMDREHTNVRHAFELALEHGDVVGTARIASALWRFWSRTGRIAEGGSLIAQALTALPPTTISGTLRGQLLLGSGVLAAQRGEDEDAEQQFHEVLRIAERADDSDLSARATNALGLMSYYQGQLDAAEDYLQRALRLSAGLEELSFPFVVQGNLGLVAIERGDYAEAGKTLAVVVAELERLGERYYAPLYMDNLGTVRRYQDDPAEALRLHLRSRALRLAIGDRWGLASTYESEGRARIGLGDYAAASVALAEGLRRFQAVGDEVGVICCIEGLAFWCAAMEQWEHAARLIGASEAARLVLQPRPHAEQPSWDTLQASVSAALGTESFARAKAESAQWSLAQTAARALERVPEEQD